MSTSATRQQASVNQAVHFRDDCRLCKSTNLTKIWSFGPTPLANSYLTPDQVGEEEVFAPLDVYYCGDCSLVQLRHVVHPDLMFRHYLYVSSTSPTFVRHFADYAERLIQQLALPKGSLVVDIGSNDGILLKPFKAADMNILGIDPAQNVAAAATAAGIPTIAEYFTPDLAQRLRAEHGPAAVITANNVFAHTDDIDLFVTAVNEFLAEDGAFVFEVQYLGDLLANNLFDIVYHEHVNYYHLAPLVSYFEQQGLEIFNVERPAVHGGSLRVFVQKKAASRPVQPVVEQILQEEEASGLNTLKPYQDFADRITANKQALRHLINDLKAQGKRLVGYGAPAKATTLCYAFDITKEDLDYIVDDSPLKQGRLMPGTHIPIKSPEALYQDQPDACLILAWNFAEPIMKNHQKFVKNGGQFIIPTPTPNIV